MHVQPANPHQVPLMLFLLGYACALSVLALLLHPVRSRARWGGVVGIDRWLVLGALANLAGLPPLAFFFFKLGLLGVIQQAGFAAIGLALGLILTAWFIYYTAAQLLLQAPTVLPAGQPALTKGGLMLKVAVVGAAISATTLLGDFSLGGAYLWG